MSKFTITCKCGTEVQLSPMDHGISQEVEKWFNFCPKCNRRWVLEDSTPEYEELVVNEVVSPENGEYEKDGEWFFADGTSMEDPEHRDVNDSL